MSAVEDITADLAAVEAVATEALGAAGDLEALRAVETLSLIHI